MSTPLVLEREARLLADQRRAATRCVASAARDTADAKLLLDVLGLDDPDNLRAAQTSKERSTA